MKIRTLPALAAALLILPGAVEAQEPNFGRALALTESELLVGQPVNWYGPGVVYDYRLGADGAWTRESMLTAPDSSRKDDFGRALALEENTLVVGAPRKRDGSGVAYAFRRDGTEAPWELAGVVEPPAQGDHTAYGISLSLQGDELLVGSPAVDGTGVIYRFVRDGDGWSPTGVISPPAAEGTAGFGTALSRHGDRLLVGAPAADSLRGRVYLVEREADGSWGTPRAMELPPEARATRAGAGTAVLLRADRAWVGVPGPGLVLAVEPDEGGSWEPTGILRPFAAGPGSRFGFALDAIDDELWIGAPGAAARDGRVYRFVADEAGGWRQAVRVDPDETDGDEWPLGFGHAVAVTPEHAAVGMPTRDFGEGRAMTLARTGSGEWEPGQVLEGEIFRIGDELASGDRCSEGQMGAFPCTNMELVSHVPIRDLGGERGVWVNDVWGWTDPETGQKWALVARRDGASFVEVTDPAAPRVVGSLPRTRGSRPSVWRDIKVIGTHAYIVSDGAGAHGMQVFDLTRLRDVENAPVEFEPDATYREIFSAHNVVADTASGFLYVVAANSGGRTCGGGLHMVDVSEPEEPTFAGCYHDSSSQGSRGYTHDAQCLVYEGPDEDYRGRQICLGANESELNIADVTDKANPRTVARRSYPNVAYAHQGWFDEEQRYFYMNDEGDEVAGLTDRTRTIVWDLSDLDDPVVAHQYLGPVPASDHNLYVVGDRMYQSNYGSGLRVLDISDRENPREVAFFDSAPYNDNEPGFSASESGAWSNYPFFGDGLVVFTSVREGLFIMKVAPPPVS
jgi:choice-of-anchor B domain-containing protein